jgi:putative endonuclease
MLFSRRAIGNQYESLAKRYLKRQGLTFIGKNFTAKCGEIDLIMQDRQCIVFVEVKYRKQTSFGHAAEFVTYRKSQRLIKTAYLWLSQKGLSPYTTDFRFDVVAIHQQGEDINWIKNAITQE